MSNYFLENRSRKRMKRDDGNRSNYDINSYNDSIYDNLNTSTSFLPSRLQMLSNDHPADYLNVPQFTNSSFVNSSISFPFTNQPYMTDQFDQSFPFSSDNLQYDQNQNQLIQYQPIQNQNTQFQQQPEFSSYVSNATNQVESSPSNNYGLACSTSTDFSTFTNASTFNNKPASTIYKLFKRSKLVDKGILKGLKAMNLGSEDNEKSIEHHRMIFYFINLNPDHNLFLRTKPYDKIIAYLISVIQQIDTNIHQVQVLIMPITIELCYHIKEIALQLTKYTKIKVRSISANDISRQKSNDHLVITTVGTAIYNLKNRMLSSEKLRYMIFEEYDLMQMGKDDGKHRDSTNLLETLLKTNNDNKMNTECKIVYLSSFIEEHVFNLARSQSSDLLHIDLIQKREEYFTNVLHFYVYYSNRCNKIELLVRLLRHGIVKSKVLIYVNGKLFPKLLKGKNEHKFKLFFL